MDTLDSDLRRFRELLVDLGRTRAVLFHTNEAWYAAGKPMPHPLHDAWHEARARWCDAFDAVNRAADALHHGAKE
jgi:hypothetical protein